MSYKVQVLLSSYNGEAYIKEQIESILNQKDVELSLLIRDDGSTDKTVSLINEFLSENVNLVCGQNIGAAKSFFELILLAEDYDYFAFSDQDDVWLADKLTVAVSKLSLYENRPAIYSSNTRLVDRELNMIADEDRHPAISLKSAIMRNYATGCTVVFNRKLMQLLKRGIPKVKIYHDWWANLAVLSVGGVSIFDDTPHILYRQHAGNAVGATSSHIGKIYNRIKRLKKGKYHRDKIASELLRIYGDKMAEVDISFLNVLADYRNNKMALYMTKDLTSNDKEIDFFFKVSIFFQLL